MALDALLFDLDGTLIDTNWQHALAWAEALERFGYRVPAERVLLEIGKGGDRLVPALLGEEVEEAQGEALREAHGERFQQRIAREGVRVFPGTRELLAACRERGLRTAVATASKKEQLDEMLERAGLALDELVDAVVNDSDVDRSKPEPDVVSAAVAKLGLAATQCAMVGDTPYDATAARRAGVVCLGVLTGAHPPQAFRRAWARGTWRDVAALHDELDAALALASPGEARWPQERLDEVMGEALAEARRAAEAGEVAVGAVVVDGSGRGIAAAHRQVGKDRQVRKRHDPTAHAALLAFAAAGREAAAPGAVLAVTREPGPMCLGAALAAGVDTILYGVEDVPGGGTERCVPPDVENLVPPRLVGGVRRREAAALLDAAPRQARESGS